MAIVEQNKVTRFLIILVCVAGLAALLQWAGVASFVTAAAVATFLLAAYAVA
jgi:hypothetical protein